MTEINQQHLKAGGRLIDAYIDFTNYTGDGAETVYVDAIVDLLHSAQAVGKRVGFDWHYVLDRVALHAEAELEGEDSDDQEKPVIALDTPTDADWIKVASTQPECRHEMLVSFVPANGKPDPNVDPRPFCLDCGERFPVGTTRENRQG